MLNKNVIDVIRQINGISNSVILNYPKTIAVSEAQDVQMLVDFSDLDEDEFPEISLKDCLSEFLSLFKLFPEDRTVNIDGNTINIESGDIQSTFIMSNAVLMDAYRKDVSGFERTEQVPSVAEFVLSTDDIKQIQASSGIFKDLTEIIFSSVDGKLVTRLGATNRFNARSNTFSISKNVECKKEFEIKIPVNNFKMIPLTEYTVKIKYNSERDAYRILMESNTLKGMKLMIAVKLN